VSQRGAVQNPEAINLLIVVLTYNGLDLTVACLESLRRVTWQNYTVLVIDNNSSDGTYEAIQAKFPEVMLLKCAQNLGFAEGNNIGLQYAYAMGYNYALLLNNDTEVAPDFLEPLVQAMESDPSCGAVGPMIFYHSQPNVIWSVGGIANRNLGKTEMRGLDQVNNGQFDEPAEVDFVTGCALLIRVSVLPAIGLIDPRFGMYFEETEWCARIRSAGYAILVVPESKIWHKISPGQQSLSLRVTYYMTRNRLLYLKLTNAPPSAWLHAALLQDWRTWLSWNLRSRWKDRREVQKAIPMAWRDFMIGRFGMITFPQ
jgi:GT2 family glycosyltransferase